LYPTLADKDYLNTFAQAEKTYLKLYVTKFVSEIKGLSVEVDGVDKPITNGAELVASPCSDLWPLAVELCAEIVSQSVLKAEDKKKLLTLPVTGSGDSTDQTTAPQGLHVIKS
jgi:hypothetical protein